MNRVCAAIGGGDGFGQLVVLLALVLSVTIATVAVCAWLEWHEEAVQRSRSAAKAEEAAMARRKGGCAVRSR